MAPPAIPPDDSAGGAPTPPRTAELLVRLPLSTCSFRSFFSHAFGFDHFDHIRALREVRSAIGHRDAVERKAAARTSHPDSGEAPDRGGADSRVVNLRTEQRVTETEQHRQSPSRSLQRPPQCARQVYAALFAPAAVRDDLMALAAFSGEVARIAGRSASRRSVKFASYGGVTHCWQPSTAPPREILCSMCSPLSSSAAPYLQEDRRFLERPCGGTLFRCTCRRWSIHRRLRAIHGTPLALAAKILGVAVDEPRPNRGPRRRRSCSRDGAHWLRIAVLADARTSSPQLPVKEF